MNRNIIFIGVTAMVTVIVIGVIAAVLIGRDVGPILGLLTVAVPLVTGLAMTLVGLKDVGDKLKEVAKLTNGNTERLMNHLESGTLPSEETLRTVRTQNDKVGEIARGGSANAS